MCFIFNHRLTQNWKLVFLLLSKVSEAYTWKIKLILCLFLYASNNDKPAEFYSQNWVCGINATIKLVSLSYKLV